jgi:hypothetical protein
MSRRRLIELLAVRWGFAALVVVAIAVGLVAAVTVAPPADIPSVALGAEAVYRVEIGAAVFFGLYVAVMAFVLATHNRGFTEIGSSGVRAQGLTGLPEDEFVMELADEIDDLETRVEEGIDGR